LPRGATKDLEGRILGAAHMRNLLLGIAFAALIAGPALACGGPGKPKFHIPAPGASIDAFMPEARLSDVELKEVRALRDEVGALVAAHQEAQAGKVEERAMRILGYKKLWLHCGPGTFIWMKLAGALTQ
jgi:hypothetical protein